MRRKSQGAKSRAHSVKKEVKKFRIWGKPKGNLTAGAGRVGRWCMKVLKLGKFKYSIYDCFKADKI